MHLMIGVGNLAYISIQKNGAGGRIKDDPFRRWIHISLIENEIVSDFLPFCCRLPGCRCGKLFDFFSF
jgi:hypothetical protein